MLLLGSCASTEAEHAMNGDHTAMATDGDQAAGDSEDEEKADPHKLEDAKHKHGIAQAKLEIAQMELEAFEKQLAIELGHAETEVKMAAAKLQVFEKVQLPNKRAQAELSLQGAKDSVVEAAEELQQLEIMYKDQDLHDMTAEFVVNRGKRRAQRAEARIQIQEREFASLIEHELPMEQRKLQIAMRKAEEKLANTQFNGELTRRGKHIKVSEAEMSLQKAGREVDKASKGEQK